MRVKINPAALLLKTGALLAIVLIAMVFGLVATTANPMFVVLMVGLIGGIFLIAFPKISITLLLSLGLVSGVLVSLVGPLSGKLPWAMALLGMSLFLPAVLMMFNKKNRQVPWFIWLALIFMLYALVSSLLNWSGFGEFVAGFKRYFQVYGLLLALAFLPLSKKDITLWQRVLLGVAILQLPFALYELLILVPARGGLELNSFATDVVAGTFGANMEGGSPNVIMVVFLLIMFSFIFSRWRNGLIDTKWMLGLGLLLLLPLGLGETKIAVVMVPLAWIVLIRHDAIKSPIKYLPVLVAGGVVTLMLLYIYVELIMHSTISEVVEGTISYNFSDGKYGESFLNRTTVLSFWYNQQTLSDPLAFFFGNGIGSSFLGQISGHIGVMFPGYGINLTTLSTLLWDLGVIGAITYIAIFVCAWVLANKLYRITNDPQVKADLLAIQVSIALFVLLIDYSQDMVNLIGLEIIYSAILGYLAYLYKTHHQGIALNNLQANLHETKR